jgi:hypothetical protein
MDSGRLGRWDWEQASGSSPSSWLLGASGVAAGWEGDGSREQLAAGCVAAWGDGIRVS